MIDAKSMDFKLDQIKLSLAMVQNDTIDDAEFEKALLSHYNSGSWISVLIISLITMA